MHYDVVKTGVPRRFRDKLGENLLIGQAATGIEVA
jgi:hypothetical protein